MLINTDFNLKIKMDNAAFQDDDEVHELAICLKQIAVEILFGKDSGIVRNSNDNVVGSWVIS